jgi:hypothetical protein
MRLRPTLIRASRVLTSTPPLFHNVEQSFLSRGHFAGPHFFVSDEPLDFAAKPRISSTSFRKCDTRSSASRNTAVSQSGGGERCARAPGLSLAWRIAATDAPKAFAKSPWSTREKRRSVVFLKVMYAVQLTNATVYIILHTTSEEKSTEGVN